MPVASVRAAAAAVTFLTRVPIATSGGLNGTDVARGALVFPVVGLAVGGVVGAAAVGLHHVLPPLLAAAIAVALGLLLTGAMHLDALADVADALGATTRERALEIMRDSRVGTFGAAAVCLDLLVKIAAIAALLGRGDALRSLLVAGCLSRAASPPLAAVLPYPRAGGGPGSVLTDGVSGWTAFAAAALAVGVAAALRGVAGLELALGVALAAATLGLLFRRWLGGATGDCLGTVTELGEIVALLVAVAVA